MQTLSQWVALDSYKVLFCFPGDAEGEGVRGPVPEAGNQLPERRTPSCPKSMFFPPLFK